MKRTLSTLARHYWRDLAIVSTILLLVGAPFLALLAAGLVAFWQQGWFMYWWLGSLVALAMAYGLRALWRPRAHRTEPRLADPGAPPAEQQARDELNRMAATVTADDLKDEFAAGRLFTRTVSAVAGAFAPNDRHALWRFTVPEAALMFEDLARRLRASLVGDFPVLRQLEIKALINVYEFGQPASRVLGLWRALRIADPLSAARAEITGLVLRQVVGRLDPVARRQAAAILVQETGEVAIRLYAGQYRRRAEELLRTAPDPLEFAPPDPVTILLAGQRHTGKSSLLNALLGTARVPVGLPGDSAGDCRSYALAAPANPTRASTTPATPVPKGNAPTGEAPTGDAARPALVLVDCPGISGGDRDAWLQQARASDLILWVAAANRADRAADQRALAALDAVTTPDPRLRTIPRVLVLTHADRLDPPLEWAPPYDPLAGARPKEQSMRAAMAAAAETLSIPPTRTALVALAADDPPWNLDALWETIHRALPEAKQKQLERALRHEGWAKGVVDGLRALPRAVSRGIDLLTR